MQRVKSKVSRDFAWFAIKKFIKPENVDFKNFFFFAKETKILGDLYLKYPNEEFWKNLNLGYQLNSFAYFKTSDGDNELEKQWRLFILDKTLDKKPNLPVIDNKIITPTPEKKSQSVFSWIDEI